jgi:hypothetical protein
MEAIFSMASVVAAALFWQDLYSFLEDANLKALSFTSTALYMNIDEVVAPRHYFQELPRKPEWHVKHRHCVHNVFITLLMNIYNLLKLPPCSPSSFNYMQARRQLIKYSKQRRRDLSRKQQSRS